MVVKSTLFWFLLVTMSAKAMTFSTFKLLSPFLLPLATSDSVSAFSQKGKGRGCSVVTDSLRPPGLEPSRFLRPRDSPGMNTGVGC